MRLIIPGASGFVGSNFLDTIINQKEFLSRYEEIVLVDILQYDEQKIARDVLANDRISFIKGSIYDRTIADSVIHAGDEVLHLAVEANTFDNPQQSGSHGIEQYLQLLVEKKVSKFLFFSTADVYGINNSDDLNEADVVNPTILYAANKAAIEAYIQAYYNLYNFPAVIFRPVTIFGPKQYPGWLIPRIITKALQNEKIQITGDGSIRRDWIHVQDVCHLIVKALAYKEKDIFGEVFTVGTGKEETVVDVVRYILKKIGKPESLIEFIPDRPGDIPRQITSAKKAKRVFNWSAEIAFYQGLDRTIEYYRQLQK